MRDKDCGNRHLEMIKGLVNGVKVETETAGDCSPEYKPNYAQQRAEQAISEQENKNNASGENQSNQVNLLTSKSSKPDSTRDTGSSEQVRLEVKTDNRESNLTDNGEEPAKKRAPKDSIVSQWLAERMQGNYCVSQSQGALYKWSEDRKVWCALGAIEKHLKKACVSIMDDIFKDSGYSNGQLTGAVSLLGERLPVMPEKRQWGIVFNNGVLNPRNGDFVERDIKELYSTSTTGVEYYRTDGSIGECSAFEKYLAQITADEDPELAEERAKVVMASMFMVMNRRTDWQMFIEVTGDGGTGKSTFANLLMLLAGRSSIASVELADLNSQERRVDVINASLIYLPDQNEYQGECGALLKITGGDPVACRFLYGQSFSTVINAVVLAVSNKPMNLKDNGGAITRRRVSIRLNNVVHESEQDSRLTEKLTEQAPAIIQHVVKWCDRIGGESEVRKILKESVTKADALEAKKETDILYTFISDLKFGQELSIQVGGNKGYDPEGRPTKLYHAYKRCCEFFGSKPLNVKTFAERFRVATQQFKVEQKNPQNVKTFKGVDLPSWNDDPEWLAG